MKALSIISIVISILQIAICSALNSNAMMAPQNNYNNPCSHLSGIIGLNLIFGLFFLAFSIVATVKSFSKK